MSLAPGCQSEARYDADLGRAQAVGDYLADHGPPPCGECGETMAEMGRPSQPHAGVGVYTVYRCEPCETERTRDDVLYAIAEGERWCSPGVCPRGCRPARGGADADAYDDAQERRVDEMRDREFDGAVRA